MSDIKRTLLCVDDEISILNSIKRLLRKDGYRILTATSGAEGLAVLTQNEVQIIISDQRMPEMNGTEFMAQVKDIYPDAMRIILTGYTEVDSITESVNKGHVYKFFLKPWNNQNLKLEIRQAFEQFELTQANKSLDKTIIEKNRELEQINEKLEMIVEERTREIALQNQALSLSHAILEEAPVSILGVDEQGIVVLANGMARSMVGEGGLNVGMHLESYFPEMVCDAASKVIDSGKRHIMEIEKEAGLSARINLSPLVGPVGGKGVILTLTSTPYE